ncbi:MAG: SDR family oxidoreductase [Gammaproteobacteria bacterium]|nr:SDR family oxidoreductase [Gammaproteobacteria bacterium]
MKRSQAPPVVIGSISSQGNKGQIAYATTKAGLEGAAATLTMEAIFHGVRCGVIHPGFTDTPMVRALGDEFIEKHILPHTQLNRLIRPQQDRRVPSAASIAQLPPSGGGIPGRRRLASGTLRETYSS